MKKVISMMAIIFLLVIIFAFTASANSTDSLHLEAYESSIINSASDEIVIKLYGGEFMESFASQNNITDIVADTNVMYMVINKYGEVAYKKIREGKLERLRPATGIPDWSEFYVYAVSPNIVFDSHVTVERIYCLSGEIYHDGVYIYYVTDQGDYVLYKEYLSSDATYLLPINDFYQFSKAICDDQVKNENSVSGGTTVEELFNLDSYVFHPRTMNDYITVIIIAIVSAVAVGGLGCWLYKSRAKR